jgi:hypothetical protein
MDALRILRELALGVQFIEAWPECRAWNAGRAGEFNAPTASSVDGRKGSHDGFLGLSFPGLRLAPRTLIEILRFVVWDIRCEISERSLDFMLGWPIVSRVDQRVLVDYSNAKSASSSALRATGGTTMRPHWSYAARREVSDKTV